MKKKICLLLICALLLFSLAGCKSKTPEEISAEKYEAMATAALTLVETYNDVAQTAIDNGWEADFETLKQMDQIADQIEEITLAVNEPANVDDTRRDQFTALAEKLTTQLNEEVLPRVSEPCPKAVEGD
jgi:predicted small lipoprotein YifL